MSVRWGMRARENHPIARRDAGVRGFTQRLQSIVENAITHGDGRVSIDAIVEQIERVHGETLTRGAICWMAFHFGATHEGEWLVASSPSEARACEACALFPQLSRQIAFELEGYATDADSLESLRRQVDEHRRALALDAVVNEAIDLDATFELQRRCHALLDRCAVCGEEQRRWIRGAVRYFIESDDASSDFVEGGLEDDRAVLDAVEAWASDEG